MWSGGELDYPDLAEDIAIEARLALQLTEEIKDLDERTTLLLKQADPTGILTSAPGVAAITAAAILGRLGDPNRFTSLAGARAFTGLVPILDASGLNGRHGGPTKRGDAVLRQALFMAAGQARRIDPTLAAKYHRLMTDAGKHHNSALCHIATTLLTRIIACWRAGQPYQLRDVDGTPVTIEQARTIIAERYTIPKDLRARHRTTTDTGTDRRNKRVAKRPINRPVHNPTLRPPDSSLTSVRNSTGRSSPAGSGPAGRGEVLFDRICAENGIRHLLTAPRSPTTTGKVERWHKTIRAEFLRVHDRRHATVEELQAALDAWVEEYNTVRPHQALGMRPPIERFQLAPHILAGEVPVVDPIPASAPARCSAGDAAARGATLGGPTRCDPVGRVLVTGCRSFSPGSRWRRSSRIIW